MKEDCFIVDSVSSDGLWVVVFEDDGETGYLYYVLRKMVSLAELLIIYGFMIKYHRQLRSVRKFLLFGRMIHLGPV